MNTTHKLYFVLLLFVGWVVTHGKRCPCDRPTTYCHRFEIYGIHVSHLFFFMFLGYSFPTHFYTLQIAGIVWELIEYALERNEWFVTTFLGGCLSESRPSIPFSKYLVVANEKKYVNPLDAAVNRWLHVENSTLHVWHFQVSVLFVNLLGFAIGKWIHLKL